MSVEVTNETVWQIDGKVFSDLGIWVMDQMRVSTQSDLTIMFVDPDPIAQLHMRWMNLEGPTDVMSFPMNCDGRRAWRYRDLPVGGCAAGARGRT
jgi:probable rRNA maturation factor